MKNSIRSLFLILVIGFASSCELDLLDNPNAVTVSNADVNFLLSSIELSYAGHFNGISDPGMRLTRMLNSGAAIYDNAVSPGGQDGNWTTAYAGIIADVNAILPLVETSGRFVHAGIARTIRASVLLNLVDVYGDVPLSEAINAENFNPIADPGATVYDAIVADLNKAIENFSATSTTGATGDLYYAGTPDNWIRVANTLKLKLYLNKRLIDKAGSTAAINALIAENKLISTAAQNFAFKYGSNLSNPDTRHPRYAGQYSPTGGGDYQSNSFMGELYNGKGTPDPRTRMYFYRQTIVNTTNVNELRCVTNTKPAHYSDADVYCLPTSVGYWGRDHLNNEGIPPDGLGRTAWGLYPAGGLYDNDAGKPVSLGAGAGGAGIHPILMRSFVDFMLAEAALTLQTTGDAKALLRSALEKSFADIRSFALATIEGSKITAFEAAEGYSWDTEVTTYIDKIMTAYDAATTDDEKMDIIGREYWIALYGNGIEAYNLYRRTGKPSNQQPGLDPNPGPFIRSFYYPNSYIARNSTAKQKPDMTVQVFWDNNPAGFIK